MLLTKKAKKDFEKWTIDYVDKVGAGRRLFYVSSLDDYKLIDTEHWIENVEECMYQALIVEWFDSVGYYCDVVPTIDYDGNIVFIPNLIVDNDMIDINSGVHGRRSGLEISIQHANNEYNKRNNDN